AAQRLPDRAAEDVHEQQGEDDREQHGVEHRLRVLPDPQQVAAHEGPGVPEMGPQRDARVAAGRGGRGKGGGTHTATASSGVSAGAVSRGAPARWPVRDRNTSSRLGSSVVTELRVMPCAVTAPTTAVSCSSLSTGTRTVPLSGSTD